MTESTMKDLLFSLAWCDCSTYHITNVKRILAEEYPEADFTIDLNEFIRCKTTPPGEGCPR